MLKTLNSEKYLNKSFFPSFRNIVTPIFEAQIYIMKKICTLLLFLLPALFSFSQSSLNVTVTGSLSYTQNLSDVWGYVDGNGTEWAIVGAFDGVSLVDLGNPANPVERFFIPGANSTWRDMKTWGQYAYITNETANGLLIIDLSNLPTSIQSKDTTIGGMNSAHNIYIDSAGYAYIAGADIDNGGLTILDLNQDPWNPTKVGAYIFQYCHDVYVRNDTAYLSEIYAGALTLVDVSNKANPVILGSVITPDQFAHNAWTNDDGTYCFVTEEVNNGYITAWDVSDPSNMVEVDRIRSSLSNGAAVPHNTHYLNGFLITSYYADGLNIIDANRPSNLVETGYYDTNPQTGGGTFGLWGAYPWLPSGLVLGTDMSTGFYVFDVNYQRAAYLEGTAYDAGTGNPLSGVEIDVQGTSLNLLTNNAGDYATGIAGGGTFTVTASKFGYATIDTTVTLAPGQVVFWNPNMPVVQPISFTITVEDGGTGNPIANASISATAQGTEFTYTTNANGQVTDANFTPGDYEVVGGQWGYITNGVQHTADATNNSVTITLERGYYDDFIFDNQWVVDPGTATSGIWEWGEPIGTYFFGFGIHPETDTTGDYGDKCLSTGNGGGSIGDDEVTGRTWITSPVMDLSDYNNPYLTFAYWFGTFSGYGNPGFRDSLICQVSNGDVTRDVWFKTDEILLGWIPSDTIWISNYLPLTSNMTITFKASENLTNHWMECAIDMVKIEDSQTVGVEEEITRHAQLQAWPNPSSGEVHFYYSVSHPGTTLLKVYDLQGRQVAKTVMQGKETTLNWKSLPGLYIAELSENGQVLDRIKLVRNR